MLEIFDERPARDPERAKPGGTLLMLDPEGAPGGDLGSTVQAEFAVHMLAAARTRRRAGCAAVDRCPAKRA
jgi:hypothetical protein